MFNNDQRAELIARLNVVLEQNQAGRADMRQQLAELLVDVARDYLKTQYRDTSQAEDNKTGMHQTRDTLRSKDFGPGQ